ncbi:hypothetical protein [Nocardia macrotermitis]|uniref:Uncharacterized protein n=1 Tax=Nocardia macrotermitis TaxID=2585198 RepID=A0A7K0CVZ3_9NOCA|nr:hypothetical protein [Nocardia macrotermitis]MQY17655.1 hypothetical protein [Nocardia macrotermitis]
MAAVVFSVATSRGDAEELDQLAGELADDLREIRGLAVGTVAAPGQAGTKSGVALEIGQLAVSGGALGTVAWLIRDVVVRFLDRTRAESITISDGERRVEIKRPSDAQVEKLIDRLGDVLHDD